MATRRLIDVRDLLELNPHDGAHRVATRAAVSVFLPLLVLWSMGRLDWSMFACFGAFTSLYGRNHVGVPRIQMQSWIGLGLVGAVVAGTAVAISPHRAWIAVVLAAGLAGAATALSERYDWHPPGALFPVFAFAGCASIPATVGHLVPALLVSLSSAALSVLIGNLGALWRHRGRVREAAPARHGWRRPSGRHVVRAAAAVLLAGGFATLLGIGHPYWAMVSAVVPLASPDPRRQLVRGLHRLIGTALGIGVSAVILSIPLSPFGLIIAATLLQAGAELLVGRNYGLALVFITPLALLMGQLAQARAVDVLLADRAIETLIGVVIGLLVGALTVRRIGPASPRTAA